MQTKPIFQLLLANIFIFNQILLNFYLAEKYYFHIRMPHKMISGVQLTCGTDVATKVINFIPILKESDHYFLKVLSLDC